MAKRTQVILEDDLDGGAAEETVTFTVNGITYELDLSAKNVEKLDEALAPFTSKARRTGGRATQSRRASGPRTTPGPEQLKAIRAWARDNGRTVSDRGRLSADVMAAYQAAH